MPRSAAVGSSLYEPPLAVLTPHRGSQGGGRCAPHPPFHSRHIAGGSEGAHTPGAPPPSQPNASAVLAATGGAVALLDVLAAWGVGVPLPTA